MSHLLRRTKKSCLKLLRKLSTSKQLFVQRLDEDVEADDDDNDEEEDEEQQQQQQQQRREQEWEHEESCTNDKQYAWHNQNHNQPDPSNQYCEDASEAFDEQSNLQIQFDLMQYKANVRYLRHTPSNSSLDLQRDLEREKEKEREMEWSRERERERELPLSVSLGSQFDGRYHNVTIMEQPPQDDYPIVKWDINGNSLDDEQPFDLRQHWAAFDSRWRQLQALPSGKRLSSAGHSQRSSHHSSACTLETWIDDAELLGSYDEAQNLLQSSQKKKKPPQQQKANNNSNNCNQCLKSF